MVTFDLLLFSRRLLSCAVAGRVFLQTCCKRKAERWTMEKILGETMQKSLIFLLDLFVTMKIMLQFVRSSMVEGDIIVLAIQNLFMSLKLFILLGE